MMKMIAIAVLLGGLVLLGAANQGTVSWPLQGDEAARGECVENCG